MLNDALFVSDALHERTIELADGSKHNLTFKELPAAAFNAYHRAVSSEDEAAQDGSRAALIAASLFNKDGTPAITLDKAMTLKPVVQGHMIAAILEVNGFGGKKSGND